MTGPLVVVHVMGRLSRGGGVQVVVRRLADLVDPAAVDLHIVTTRPPWDDLSAVPVTLHPLGFDGSHPRAWHRIVLMWKVARAVRRLRADVVQLHSGVAWLGLLARLASPLTPFVLEVHDAPGSGRHDASTDRFEGFCIRRLGMRPVCHSTQVSLALQQLSRISERSIRQFPLGIDTTRFLPTDDKVRSAFRERHELDPQTLIAVAIGRPARSKRFDLAIDAVADARDRGAELDLVVIGIGKDASLLEHSERRGARDRVHLLSAVHGDDLAQAISSCDILLSTSEYEGFGLTIVEGMSCGLPVVAMAVGGVTDLVIEGTTGYLVPEGDVDGFAQRLVDLCASVELRRSMGRAGRQRAVEVFDARETAASFTNLYEELARG